MPHYTFCQFNISPAVNPVEMGEISSKKKRRRRRELIADLDWWSKYYASLVDVEEVSRSYEKIKNSLFYYFTEV